VEKLHRKRGAKGTGRIYYDRLETRLKARENSIAVRGEKGRQGRKGRSLHVIGKDNEA